MHYDAQMLLDCNIKHLSNNYDRKIARLVEHVGLKPSTLAQPELRCCLNYKLNLSMVTTLGWDSQLN